jgi:hypothetical protein
MPGQLPRQSARTSCEANEDAPSNVGRDIGRVHLPQGGRINEIGVALDDLSEGSLGAVFGVISKKLGI